MIKIFIITYLLIWGIRTTVFLLNMPSVLPLYKFALISLLFPIELLIKIISLIYSIFGIGVYFECSLLMTEEELKNFSDEFNKEDESDR